MYLTISVSLIISMLCFGQQPDYTLPFRLFRRNYGNSLPHFVIRRINLVQILPHQHSATYIRLALTLINNFNLFYSLTYFSPGSGSPPHYLKVEIRERRHRLSIEPLFWTQIIGKPSHITTTYEMRLATH